MMALKVELQQTELRESYQEMQETSKENNNSTTTEPVRDSSQFVNDPNSPTKTTHRKSLVNSYSNAENAEMIQDLENQLNREKAQRDILQNIIDRQNSKNGQNVINMVITQPADAARFREHNQT